MDNVSDRADDEAGGEDGGGVDRLRPGPQAPVRLLVVDDDALVRQAILGIFAESTAVQVVGEADDGDAVRAAVDRYRPHVVLMDLRMPRVDGITATRELMRRSNPPAVVVLTTFQTDDDIIGALSAGAAGYLVKHSPPDRIEAAVRDVAAGLPATSPTITRFLINSLTEQAAAAPQDPNPARPDLALLTSQERSVALAVAAGQSNSQIAERLHLSVSTVKTYVSNALAKLQLQNRTQLALLVRTTRP